MAEIDELMTRVAALTDRVSLLVGRRDLSQIEFANWLAGTATGGPNGDGFYPLTDSAGVTRLFPCPAKVGGGSPVTPTPSPSPSPSPVPTTTNTPGNSSTPAQNVSGFTSRASSIRTRANALNARLTALGA